MSSDALHAAIRSALAAGHDARGVLAAARAVDADVSTEDVLRVTDALADRGEVAHRVAPPTDALDRRGLLRGFLASSAAVAGVAVAVTTPSLAGAVEGVCSPELSFRTREREVKREAFRKQQGNLEETAKGLGYSSEEYEKAKPRLKEERAKQFDETRVKYTRERDNKGGSRYAATGPAPLWVLPEVGDELMFEVERSSIKADVEGSCTVVMDLRVDTLDGGNVKEPIALLERLAPGKPGAPSPLLTVSWGEEGEEAFQGYLDSTVAAYDAFLPDGTPVRAVIRATFLIA